MRSVWLGVVACGVASLIALGWFLYEGHRPISQKERIDLVIPYGSSAREVAAMIRDAGVDIHEGMFLLHARWLGVHRQLKAGVYSVEAGLTKRQFIQRMAGQDPTHIEFRVVEGWTVKQTVDALAATPALRFDLGAATYGTALAGLLDLPTRNPEGWIYPDAYIVRKGSNASELLKRAAAFQRQVLQSEWDKRREGLPYRTMEEALVVASIVEKETQFPGDRERVAAVFSNRLRIGMPLQADPTVIYGLGDRFSGDLTRADLRRDTPYNTYTRKTLPPTPIANPGRRALRAVMNPSDSQALYFVARGDGSSHFSETLAEHNSAVDRYIRRLASGGKSQ